jgi:K+-transporting ATPase KdpF subunit
LDFGFWILDFRFWVLDFGLPCGSSCGQWILDFRFFFVNFMNNIAFNFSDVVTILASKRHRIPVSVFFLLCFNTLLAPAVQAATPAGIPHWQSYTMALLGLVTVCLSVYLFVVIFQPERF